MRADIAPTVGMDAAHSAAVVDVRSPRHHLHSGYRRLVVGIGAQARRRPAESARPGSLTLDRPASRAGGLHSDLSAVRSLLQLGRGRTHLVAHADLDRKSAV